jgi:AhpD family alkylhydroperoxidase
MSTPYRYVTPVSKQAATGQVAAVYAQLAADFGLDKAPTFMTLSPTPDLLAATWALMRESLLAGSAPRAAKEVVAAGVSLANRCPFCVDAHTMMLHATGDHRLAETIARGDTPDDPYQAAVLAWATATRTPGAAELSTPPFPAGDAAEYLGTALAFHFINRVVSALLTDNFLPGNLQRSRVVRNLGGRAFARTVRRRLPVGASLPLLGEQPTGSAAAWAADSPVGPAYLALRTAAMAGGALLSEPAREVVTTAIERSDGAHPPLTGGWLTDLVADLPDDQRPGARLALLAALAPYRVADSDVAAWRSIHPDDADLVRLVAFGAILAVEKVEAAASLGDRRARPPARPERIATPD